jgi:phospholipid/cholesterol/gamma-HCH transport system substrate-binding protein
LKVGVLSVAALIILIVLLFLMTGASNPFSTKFVLYAYFRDSVAMTEGSAVRLNGILVGKVKAIELTGSRDNSRAIRMTLEIDDSFKRNLPQDSTIGFGAENVLGTKYLDIDRGQSSQPVHDGSELKARDDKDFMEMLQSAYPLVDSMQIILKRIDGLVAQLESGNGSIGKLLYNEDLYNKVNAILTDFQKITAALASGKGTIGALLYDESLYDESLYAEIRSTVKRFDDVVANLQQGEGTAGKLLKDPALYDDLRQSSAELKTLLANLNAGKGSAGKMLTDESLHTEAVQALKRLNGTLDKINAGQGTLGQLMTNPALYDNLVGTSADIRASMKEFRANPKKFLTIRLKLF